MTVLLGPPQNSRNSFAVFPIFIDTAVERVRSILIACVDRERILIAYADGCLGSCVAAPPNSFNKESIDRASDKRQAAVCGI